MDEPNQSAPMAEPPAVYPTPRQRRILWIALTAVAVTSLLGVAALVFFGFITFLSWSYPILLPIGLAVIIALVLEPVVAFVQKRGLKRGTATLLVCLLTVIGFLLFWAFLLPPLVSQAGGFFQSLPDTLSKGVAKFDATIEKTPEQSPHDYQPVPPMGQTLSALTNQLAFSSPVTNQAPEISTEFPSNESAESSREKGREAIQAWLKTNLPAIRDSIQKNIANVVYSALGPVGQAFGFLLGFGFVPIYVFYFLADEERITQHWHEFVPLRRSPLRDEVVSVLAEINTSLVGYFRGQIIVAGCNGVLTFIGLWAIGIPYSLVLGIMTGALSIVPFLGIICSIIPALLLGFLSAKNDPTLQWLRPVLVLGVFALVQMTESMFITPRVQSHSTGLHPLAIILGILFWSMLLPGLLGPIVAVPLTCAVVVLLRRYVWQEKSTE
ncbi:MAG: AI-2E family transporter [Methylacidiphilales bacterium]|nr:AI-2E family transporter [Candidatus Methylacidiphilales bacterium]